MKSNVAILIVNGGKDPEAGRWLSLCLDRILVHTIWPNYHLYVWNNNLADPWVAKNISRIPNATLVEADPDEVLTHKHAVPLQRLYELALKDNPKYVVALDSDAHPIRDGWLSTLINELDGGAVIAGIWRDEEKEKIRPYLHASCLATTVRFVEDNSLRFDFIAPKRTIKHDTLSSFTDAALELDKPIYKFRRSNRNQFHPIIGGIYGDTIYHHGAGSRPVAQFWHERRSRSTNHENKRIRDRAATLLFEHYQEYIAWLRGEYQPDLVFILGMHRSGTSCLAGALELCGLNLGDVNRFNRYNLKGSHEDKRVAELHRKILRENEGAWDSPPSELVLNPGHYEEIRSIALELADQAPAGIKEPRMLLFMDGWKDALTSSEFIGTFRHPVAVAQSLYRRDGMPLDKALELWLEYNRILVELHRSRQFPLIDFDLSDKETYIKAVAGTAVRLGLKPDLEGMGHFVSTRLDHSDAGDLPIPPICEEVYSYLHQNRLRPKISGNSFTNVVLELSVNDDSWWGLREELYETAALAAQYLPKSLTHRGRRILRPLWRKMRPR